MSAARKAPSLRLPAFRNPLATWIGNRSLNTKIMIIVGAMTIVAAAVGIVALARLAEMSSVGEKLFNQSFAASKQLGQITSDTGTMHAYVLTYGQSPAPEIAAAIKQMDAKIAEDITAYKATTINPQLM